MTKKLAFTKKVRRNELRYNLSINLLGYPFELKTCFESMFNKGKEPGLKFVIFSSGRSGSTLLMSLLNSHPQVFCDTELLKRKLLNPMKHIERRSILSDSSVFGFKLLSFQLQNVQNGIKDKSGFLKNLVNKGFKVLYLRRENKLQQSISAIYGMYRYKWHSDSESKNEIAKIEMDLSIIEKYLKGMEKLDKFEMEVLENIPHLPISYEKELADSYEHQTTIEKVAHYLQVQAIEPKTKLRKTTPKELSSFILNSNEILNHFQNSRYIDFYKMTYNERN